MAGAVRLYSDKACDAQVERFLELWESAWKRLPAAIQHAIEQYWRNKVAPELCRTRPHVKDRYDPHITLFKETLDDDNAGPQTLHEGHIIIFPAQFMDRLVDDLAIVAIAHELAHVSFYAEAEPNHWPDAKNATAYNAAECLVDARLLEWGFTKQMLGGVDELLASRSIRRFCQIEWVC